MIIISAILFYQTYFPPDVSIQSLNRPYFVYPLYPCMEALDLLRRRKILEDVSFLPSFQGQLCIGLVYIDMHYVLQNLNRNF